jgi:hypothetical protein
MQSTIPASAIVQVTPSVISAGGSALDLNGLVLTENTRVPVGMVLSFASRQDVASHFGSSSDEASAAAIYFGGFEGSNVKPGAMLWAQYPAAAVPAYLRSGVVSGMTLANLQALTGTISMSIDGVPRTSAAINLSGAGSFSQAAALIQTALGTAVDMTATIAANVVTGSIAANVVTGSIAGTTLTVTAVTTGVLAAGQTVSGDNVAVGTTIVRQLTGSPVGGVGTYQVSASQTVISTTLTASGGGLTVSAVTTGTLAVGQTITGAGVAAGTTITAAVTGTGGTGKYAVNHSQAVSSETLTASGGTLTVSVATAGAIGVGSVLQGVGITVGNHVTALLTGTGGVGTYLVATGDTFSGALTTAGTAPTVAYDSVSGAFVITSGISGAASTIGYAASALSTSLKLTLATGAVLSQGSDAGTPADFMDWIISQTTNWATFMTLFNPDTSGNTVKQAFAAWANAQGKRYAYVAWDTDITPTESTNAAASLGRILLDTESEGTIPIYAPDYKLAAFVCGAVASIDFTERNGRITLAFKAQGGMTPSVTNETVGNNLKANGYNFYGAYATANDQFVFFYPGSITGTFDWADSYINQIWLNNAFQLALMVLLTNIKSLPYNNAGYALVRAACQDPINQGLNFGAFAPGTALSAAQIAEVNNAAGRDIATTLVANGWYLLIEPAIAQVRAARASPPLKFFYCDAGSVQTINLASVEVQ